MKHVYITDGHDMQQTLQTASPTRAKPRSMPRGQTARCTDTLQAQDSNKLTKASWFSLPPAHPTPGRHQACQPLTPTTSLLESP
jgi:hypothetical protein